MLTHKFQANSHLIISGQAKVIVIQNSTHNELKVAGVTLLGQGNMARVKSADGSIILRAVKIIIRASGRNRRHLARYLVGVDQGGIRWEIFLGVVQGLRNGLFQARVWLQQKLLKLSSTLLATGLSSKQRLNAIT